jgi:hypothetical protein
MIIGYGDRWCVEGFVWGGLGLMPLRLCPAHSSALSALLSATTTHPNTTPSTSLTLPPKRNIKVGPPARPLLQRRALPPQPRAADRLPLPFGRQRQRRAPLRPRGVFQRRRRPAPRFLPRGGGGVPVGFVFWRRGWPGGFEGGAKFLTTHKPPILNQRPSGSNPIRI